MTSIPTAWTDRKTIELKGLRVTLAEPVLVRRSKRFCWFPGIMRQKNGDLWAGISAQGDEYFTGSAMHLTRSCDGGLTWDEPRLVWDGGLSHVLLADGSVVILPFTLQPRPDGMGASGNLIQPDGRVRFMLRAVEVTGWPRPDKPLEPDKGLAGFVFNGQSLTDSEGKYLTTLYGCFEGDKRYSLVLAESDDGFKWRIRSTIAGGDCSLEGDDGPCEPAICRLADAPSTGSGQGRLMCVFRMSSFVPYGQSWSADEGHTWSTPVAMTTAMSVEPSLQTLPSGVVALSGGRSGIFVWLNADGRGADWQTVDMVAHHNACLPPTDHINPDSRQIDTGSEEMFKQGRGGYSSCYTRLITLDERHLLLIYDRIGLSWQAIPDESDATNSVWVTRLTVE